MNRLGHALLIRRWGLDGQDHVNQNPSGGLVMWLSFDQGVGKRQWFFFTVFLRRRPGHLMQ